SRTDWLSEESDLADQMVMEAIPHVSLIWPPNSFLRSSILPQAVCAPYGMAVGAMLAPLERLLLWVFFPVAYPISKFLDWMLGKGHSVLLHRAELKTFVDFHGNEAGKGGDLTHDETTIIPGALELTEKTAKDAMTAIPKAFSLSLDGRTR
ncbi:CNNM, transmembrane domain, partial [Dillenia turbinata]